MRFKKIKQRSDHSLLLQVQLDKKDTFNYVMAKHLSENRLDGLLSFTFDEDSATPDLFYRITGLAPLKTLLSTKLSLAQFRSLLNQIAMLLDALTLNDMPEKNVLFEPENIYTRLEDFSLQFIYLPLDSQPVKERAVLDLLTYLAHGASFVIEEDKRSADDFMDFIKRQSVFSLVDLKTYLGINDPLTRTTGPMGTPATAAPVDNNAVQPTLRPRRRTGRDFVSELTGVQTKGQRLESQSLAQNVLSAISDELVTGPVVPGNDPPRAQGAVSGTTSPERLVIQNVQQVDSGRGPAVWAAPVQGQKRFVLIRKSDGMTWALNPPVVSIGRSMSAQLQVSDSTMVSRIHAILYIENGLVSLEDNGSSNGTLVNGYRLTPRQRVRVGSGDSITLGNQVFQLL